MEFIFFFFFQFNHWKLNDAKFIVIHGTSSVWKYDEIGNNFIFS